MIYADMNTREAFKLVKLVAEGREIDSSITREAASAFRGMGKGENRENITSRNHSTHGQVRPKFRVWIQNSAPREKL